MNNEPNEEVSSSEVDTTSDTGTAWKLPSTLLRTIHFDYGVHKQFKGVLRASATSRNYQALRSRLNSESFSFEDDAKAKEKKKDDSGK
jgi:hypothetical protein